METFNFIFNEILICETRAPGTFTLTSPVLVKGPLPDSVEFGRFGATLSGQVDPSRLGSAIHQIIVERSYSLVRDKRSINGGVWLVGNSLEWTLRWIYFFPPPTLSTLLEYIHFYSVPFGFFKTTIAVFF